MSEWIVKESKPNLYNGELIDYVLECSKCGRIINKTLKVKEDYSKIKCECENVESPSKVEYDKNIDTRLYRYWSRNRDKMCEAWKEDFKAFELWSYQNGYRAWLVLKSATDSNILGPNNCMWVSSGKINEIDKNSTINKNETIKLLNNSHIMLNGAYDLLNREIDELELLGKSRCLNSEIDASSLIKELRASRNKIDKVIKVINKLNIM